MTLFPIDAHTHINAPKTAEKRIINGTSPEDWESLALLAEQYPDKVVPAFGLHPWYIRDVPADWLDILHDLLIKFPHALVGEIGLDKSRRPKIPLEIQKTCFLPQWELARTLNRPAVLHCVKAWPLLLPLLKNNPRPFLCHGFSGPAEYIPSLSEKGAYFSLGPRQLSSPSLRTLILLLPGEKILMESDGSSEEDFRQSLLHASTLLDMEPSSLSRLIVRNAETFLNLSHA